jgi:hypothetical protein
MSTIISEPQIVEFVEYMLDFYGPNGVYDVGMTEAEVREALPIRLLERADLEFDGDTVDREICEAIVINNLRQGRDF